jgi:hypothetical protein
MERKRREEIERRKEGETKIHRIERKEGERKRNNVKNGKGEKRKGEIREIVIKGTTEERKKR